MGRYDRIRLQPAGAYATHLLGLSEQIPAKVLFLTDGDVGIGTPDQQQQVPVTVREVCGNVVTTLATPTETNNRGSFSQVYERGRTAAPLTRTGTGGVVPLPGVLLRQLEAA